MRIAVFGDIHGNIQALDAALADIAAQKADAVYCLGDLVGYGANPNEVTARIRDGGYPTIMGNYDDGVGFDRDECGCAYRDAGGATSADSDRSSGRRRGRPRRTRRSCARWRTRSASRPTGERILLVHGSPRKMNEYLFEDRPLSSFQRLAASSNADVIVFGHTHKPYVKEVDGVLFVNAGSVGKPKDGDWRACYVT